MTEPLSHAWETWGAENLLRGADPAKIEARLVQEGLLLEEAKRTVEVLSHSPFRQAAAPFIQDARRWNMLCRLADHRRQKCAQRGRVVRRGTLSAADLNEVFRPGSIPVVIPGLLRDSPVMERWAPEALARRFGAVEISMTVTRANDANYAESFQRPAQPVSVAALVARMARETNGDCYVVALNHALAGELGAMLDDLTLPEGYLDGPLRERASLWMGPAGTHTALHHDRTDILFLQVHGRKRWQLIAPTERALLKQVRGVATLLQPTDLGVVEVKEVVLQAGDALLLPVGWWHQVDALDASVSLSVSLDPDGALEFFQPAQV